MSEVRRLIRINKENGNHAIDEYHDSYLQPVYQDKSSCDMIIESIMIILNLCKKHVEGGIVEYRVHSGD